MGSGKSQLTPKQKSQLFIFSPAILKKAVFKKPSVFSAKAKKYKNAYVSFMQSW